MEPLGFDILLEAGPLLAVNKPPGLLTQAPAEIDSLEARVRQFLKQREQKPGNIYLGVPHRLDRPASGVLLLARHVRAARRVAEQFEGRLVHKVYWACVAGRVEPEQGTWVDQMRKVPGEARAERVPADHPDSREAVLHYRTLAHWDRVTLPTADGSTFHPAILPTVSWLEVVLETGRMHQVRLQAGSRGHAVLGDRLYGSQVDLIVPTGDARLLPIALHARSIRLRHPMTQEPLEVVAPLPACWQTLPLPVAAQGPTSARF